MSACRRSLPGKLEGPLFIAYVKGFDKRLLVTFPKEKEQQKSPTTSNAPRPPRGSEGESEGEEAVVEKVDPKTVPNWTSIKERLERCGWKGSLLDWWKCKEPRTRFPPRFRKTRRILIAPEERGLKVMQEIGVFTYLVPPHSKGWQSQPQVVRRFWRTIFLQFSDVYWCQDIPVEDFARLFAYQKTNLPFIYQQAKTDHPFVTTETVDRAQLGFFARLFDLALQVKRHGFGYLYSPRSYREAWQYTRRAFVYTREKYPFIKLSLLTFFAHVLIDELLERLWFNEWNRRTGGRLLDLNLERVWTDFLEEHPVVLGLECFCPHLAREIVHARGNGHGGYQLISHSAVRDSLFERAIPWYNFPVYRRASQVFTLSQHPEYEKRHCDPEFLRIEHEKTVQDPNWIRYPKQKVIFPRRLQALRFPIPALPLIPEEQVELGEMILNCILKDRFFFRQPKWYVGVPIFLREDDGWYFNSSFYDFSRKTMRKNFIDTMLNKF
jgi:hypothetical protein